ncbi:MAG: hypothetical protein QW667_03560 [Candidatus Bathyarchaeia archaeon]
MLKESIYQVARKIFSLLRKIISPFIKLFSVTSNYTDRGAEVVKVIPVLMIFFLITYPLWSLPVYIWLAVTYGEPLNYILYALWITQIVIILLVNAYFEYLRKHKSE